MEKARQENMAGVKKWERQGLEQEFWCGQRDDRFQWCHLRKSNKVYEQPAWRDLRAKPLGKWNKGPQNQKQTLSDLIGSVFRSFCPYHPQLTYNKWPWVFQCWFRAQWTRLSWVTAGKTLADLFYAMEWHLSFRLRETWTSTLGYQILIFLSTSKFPAGPCKAVLHF